MDRLKSALRSPRIVATAVVAFGGLATYLLDFPGSMEDDSFVQLLEGRTDSYGNWHPPIMSWMLGVSDSLSGHPAACYTAFQMLLAFGALGAVLWLPRRVTWAAVPAAIAMLALPQFLMLQAVVWKDALFANAALAGYVCLAHAAVHWERAWARYGLLAASAGLLAIAVLARQNGIVILAGVPVALYFVAGRNNRRRGVAYGAGAVSLCCAMVLAGNAALQLRSDGTPARMEQIKILQLYDITGMVYRDLALPLTVLERDKPDLARIIRTEGVARWSPVKNDTLEVSPRIVDALDSTSAEVLARQWRTLILHYPLRYLAVRAELFRWVFQPPDVGLCHPFHVGDEGDPGDLRELGIQPRLDRRDVALWHYGDFFENFTPVFSHAFWAVLAAAAMVLLLKRRDSADIVLAALIGSAFLFTATFFVISIACDYRYLYLIDLSALAGGLYVAADWRDLKRVLQRKRGPEGPL
jgi:hypothetical protein